MRIQYHDLKLQAEYWDAVASGEKCFEVRKDDRGFQRGDVLILRKYGNNETFVLSGNSYLSPPIGKESRPTSRLQADTIWVEITYILTGGKWGIDCGYVVMGIKKIASTEVKE